jgi:hypothetical protein
MRIYHLQQGAKIKTTFKADLTGKLNIIGPENDLLKIKKLKYFMGFFSSSRKESEVDPAVAFALKQQVELMHTIYMM